MKRSWTISLLSASALALVACANDKPVNDASSSATSTTSARYPDGTMSSNANDTSATGAATNMSPESQPGDNAGYRATSTTPKTSSNAASNGATTVTVDKTPPPGNEGNASGASGGAQPQPATIAPPPPHASSDSSVTPIDQGNGKSDLKITQAIRKEVVGNSDLSFTAKNVKIITTHGRVVLKGEVKTQAEKQAIEGTATRVAGNANVDDQIVVRP